MISSRRRLDENGECAEGSGVSNERLPRFALPDSAQLSRQAASYGLDPVWLERLAVMDRLLRSLVGSTETQTELFGYALSGPAAIVGVYLHTNAPIRIPDELTLVPVRRDRLVSPAVLAARLAETLREGSATLDSVDPEAWHIGFRNSRTPNEVILRFERSPLAMDPPSGTIGASHRARGYLWDERIRFRSRLGTPFPVPVAYAEEIILRDLRALALWARRDVRPPRIDDRAARVDDLRLLSVYDYEALRDAMLGSIRQRLGELVPERFPDWCRSFVTVIDEQIKRHAAVSALPAGARSTRDRYDVTAAAEFSRRMGGLLDEFLATV
jgi:hypothetical protein